MDEVQVGVAVDAIESCLPHAAIVGLYLYGSAVSEGLRPDSDIDLAVILSRRLSVDERQCLVESIQPLSRGTLRPREWRPLEVTAIALPDVRPWRYPPSVDLQYGEWLTDLQLAERVRQGASPSPDAAVLIAMLRQSSRPYRGTAAAEVLPAVPQVDLVRATLDAIPALLADLEADTRNVLLTLARMWSTTVTSTITSKDDAALWAAARLSAIEDRELIERARRLYLDGGWGEWGAAMPDVRRLAHRMVDEMRRDAASGPARVSADPGRP